jgi:hypothetical protein
LNGIFGQHTEAFMRSIYLSSVAVVTMACSLEAPSVSDADAGGGAAGNQTAGTGSNTPQAGTSSAPLAGTSSTGGSSSTSGASSTGGVSSIAGSGLGGTGSGGTSPGGTSSGGTSVAGSSSTGGAAGGVGGAMVDDSIGKPLEGLRIDDPCTGSPSTATGSTCNHLMNPFHKTVDATLGGTPGTTYDVTLRVRGVVEPTKITGGTRPDTSTVVISGKMYRKTPYTVGGTPGDQTYQPWLFSVARPAQNYFFNDYGVTEHSSFLLDYQVTIPMEGGTKVTLDVNDGNDHEIDNYAKLTNDGIPGSMNLGQYVQLSVVSVKPH